MKARELSVKEKETIFKLKEKAKMVQSRGLSNVHSQINSLECPEKERNWCTDSQTWNSSAKKTPSDGDGNIAKAVKKCRGHKMQTTHQQ